MSITVWNTPTRGNGDLRDASRLIRGARQGILFLVNGQRVAETLMEAALGLLRDKDLFVEGLSWSTRGRTEYRLNEQRVVLSPLLSARRIDSTIVLVDPFGPHPVVITGSHDLSLKSSAKNESDLLVIENVPSLAAEYAVHLIGLFDHFRWQAFARASRGLISLQANDVWQQRYFKGNKRSEFNFLFGSLSPGL
jgi:hypothetical protein